MTDQPTEPGTAAELRQGLTIVAEHLIEEARRRGWCEAYEEFVRDVNAAAGWDVLWVREPEPEPADPYTRHYSVVLEFDARPTYEVSGRVLQSVIENAVQMHKRELYPDQLNLLRLQRLHAEYTDDEVATAPRPAVPDPPEGGYTSDYEQARGVVSPMNNQELVAHNEALMSRLERLATQRDHILGENIRLRSELAERRTGGRW